MEMQMVMPPIRQRGDLVSSACTISVNVHIMSAEARFFSHFSYSFVTVGQRCPPLLPFQIFTVNNVVNWYSFMRKEVIYPAVFDRQCSSSKIVVHKQMYCQKAMTLIRCDCEARGIFIWEARSYKSLIKRCDQFLV